VPEAHALVALDITNPEQPREVSTLDVGKDEKRTGFRSTRQAAELR
jgi:hypothetical protein